MAIFAAAAMTVSTAIAPVNCAPPATPLSKAICADPSLRAADNSLTAAYNALLQRTLKISQPALAAFRADMEKSRELCLVNPSILTDCLRDMTDRQRWTVSGAPFSGPGTESKINTVFIGREETLREPRYSVLLPLFIAPQQPGARLLNRALGRYFQDAPYRRTSWREPALKNIYAVTGEVAYATPHFVSIRMMVSQIDSDGAPRHRSFGLNQVLDANTRSAFSSLFSDDAVTRLTPICREKIDQYSREFFAAVPMAGRPKIDPAAVAQSIGDLESWVFDAAGAKISFVEGSTRYVCSLDVQDLRPLLAPGAKIWP